MTLARVDKAVKNNVKMLDQYDPTTQVIRV